LSGNPTHNTPSSTGPNVSAAQEKAYTVADAHNFPSVVTAIILLNVAIFILETVTGGSTNTLNLVRFGAQATGAIENGEYWRFLTAAFLHIGVVHLVINSICLWRLGTLLEDLYGSTHFAFLYLVCGVAGTLTSFFLNEFVSPQIISAGASGAIFGVASAMLIAGLRYSDQIPESLQSAFGTGILPFLVFNLYYGLAKGGVDNYAHIGGALAGAVVGAILHPHVESRRNSDIAAASLAGLVLVCFGLQYWSVVRFERNLRAADVLFHLGRFGESKAVLATLQRAGTDDARVETLAAMLSLREGKINDVLEHLKRADKVAPRYAPAKIVRGELMMLARNYGAAVAFFQEAARLDPQDPVAQSSLGGALLSADRAEEAVVAFGAALRLDPRSAQAHYGLALALEKEQKPEDAAKEYRAAIALAPRSAAVLHGLARVLFASGKKDEAATALQKILEFEPADELARRTLTELTGPSSGGRN
jgi:membrane associated rhomboid family serine protease/thioredoxin-like negative regulator of GroEL